MSRARSLLGIGLLVCSPGCVAYKVPVVFSPSEMEVDQRITWLIHVVATAEAPSSCHSASTQYRSYKAHREQYRHHSAQREHWDRQAKSARWMADQNVDSAFWRRVEEQHRWQVENSLRNERRASEQAEEAKRIGDSDFYECRGRTAN